MTSLPPTSKLLRIGEERRPLTIVLPVSVHMQKNMGWGGVKNTGTDVCFIIIWFLTLLLMAVMRGEKTNQKHAPWTLDSTTKQGLMERN